MRKLNLLILALIFSGLQMLNAQSNSEQVKLERIVKLSWFIDWSQNKSFSAEKKRLYVLSDDISCQNFKDLSKNNPKFHDWEIICINKNSEIKEGSVVFISKVKEKYIDWIINISTTKDILTIADNSDNFCNKGGMINIIENAGQIKFEVNYRIIQNKSIDISSKLLALSKIYD